MTELNIIPDQLIQKYSKNLEPLIHSIVNNNLNVFGTVLTAFLIGFMPSIMKDVGIIKNLSGLKKKELVINTMKSLIKLSFEKLNQYPQFKQVNWDELVEECLLTFSPALIDLMISIENGEIKFNKKFNSCLLCIK